MGWHFKIKSSFSKIAGFWGTLQKNGNNIIFSFIKNTHFLKILWVWLKNWACHALSKLKTKMSVAGIIFELYLYIFNFFLTLRDTQMILVRLFEFSICLRFSKTPPGGTFPDYWVFSVLVNSEDTFPIYQNMLLGYR